MFQSMRNRDVPPETCARNRHKCIEYVPRGYRTNLLLYLFPPERVCWQRCIPSDQCDVSESSFIYGYFLLIIFFYKLIQISLLSHPQPSPSLSVYGLSHQSMLNYLTRPYTGEAGLVAGYRTHGRPKLRLSPLPFLSALLSLLLL